MIENTRVCVVDLEATCTPNGLIPAQEMETIEIGAVLVDLSSGIVGSEFQRFVKPVRHPQLTDFCRQLTTIEQHQVDQAMTFPEVFGRFCAWLTSANLDGFCSWSEFDRNQLQQDCMLHGIEYPLRSHVDLCALFRQRYRKKRGHRGAMRVLGLKASGTHHRGIDDARNIAKMIPTLLGGK